MARARGLAWESASPRGDATRSSAPALTGTRQLACLAAPAVGAPACSRDVPTGPTSSPLLAKSGTAPSGGGGGSGGGSTGTQSGPPVAPSYTARIDSIGAVPTAMYSSTPSVWVVGGYTFESTSLTHLEAPEGPLVVGACISVTFSLSYTGAYLASELGTEVRSKWG